MGVNEIIKVGTNIKTLRKEKGLTQKNMASLLSIPSSTYSNYENNNREPGKETLCKISKILDVDIYDLLGTDKKSDLVSPKDIYIPYESININEVTVIEKLIKLCGFNINFNEFQENDSTLDEYLKLEIKNNLIPLAYINKGNISLNLTNDQFKEFSNKILQLVSFEINELVKDI